MKHAILSALVLGWATTSVTWADDDSMVKQEPTHIGAWIDAGQVVKGQVDFDQKVKMQVLTRSKVALTQVATVNDRLTLTGAMGGLFFYSLPNDPNGPHTRLTKFTAVLEEASGYYPVGDLDKPWMDAKFGLFFEKYNPDATNLGEYLFRSGTYPGYLQTGGWYIVNNAGYFLQGFRTSFHFLDGALNPQFLMAMERDWEPTFDLTPAFIVNYKAGAFDVGVGAAFNHLIAAKPSATSPNKKFNGWYTTAAGKDTLYGLNEGLDTLKYPGAGNYTFQGTKLSFRASFNVQSILELDMLAPEDLKIYTEIALLGVKDYPIYYEKKANRMPMMAGINLPTFKFFEKFAFEMEYYNTDLPNSLEEVYQRTLPIPGNIGGSGTKDRQAYIDSLGTHRKMRDKIKWSFLLNKQISTGLGVYLQVASDHFRPIDFNLKPTYEPITQNWNEWYYMFRLNFGI